ncbi:MAG: endo-1,4-beta-xylanase [Phycisphaerae bacterium]
MLRFKVFHNRKPAESVLLDGAYLLGSDGVPLRAELSFGDGEIRCSKRAAGPAALCLPWPIEGYGRLMLETTRLSERETPYHLHVELARGRLMKISHKREDWGLYDYSDGAEYYRQIDEAKAPLIDAITATDDATAAELADQSLAAAVRVGEELSLFHADIFLARRKATGQFVKRPLGVTVLLNRGDDPYRRYLPPGFDFAVLPTHWRDVEPRSGTQRWETLDLWVNWLAQHKLHVRGAPLVSLERLALPDWAVPEAADYENFRDLLLGHAMRLVKRFAHRVQSWEVVHGIHAFNTFHMTFEQLMELTRLAALIVKQNAPRSASIVTVVLPWGEYYARDIRTIPPLLYADMCVQSGFHFDAFGLEFQFGVPVEGMLVRDMMQVSALLDRFAAFNKPLHVTAVAVPSTVMSNRGPESLLAGGGQWREPWSEGLQARWLRQFYEIAFSKPFVETIAWRDLSDSQGRIIPTGGLLHADLTPKPAFESLLDFRRSILGDRPGRHARDRAD